LKYGDIEVPKKVMFFAKKEVTKVCAGQFHSLALTADNELYAWGKG
jgi:alpha-tubulin suppressor-like RCC1 family protein